MAQNRKAVKEGKYIGLFLNTETGEFEIWQIYRKQYEMWDNGMTDREEALEVYRYAEKHYADGM